MRQLSLGTLVATTLAGIASGTPIGGSPVLSVQVDLSAPLALQGDSVVATVTVVNQHPTSPIFVDLGASTIFSDAAVLPLTPVAPFQLDAGVAVMVGLQFDVPVTAALGFADVVVRAKGARAAGNPPAVFVFDISSFEVQPQQQQAPNVDFTISSTPTYVGDDVTLTASNSGGPVDDYTWSIGGQMLGGSQTTVQFAQKGTFNVTLTATGPGGMDSETKSVKVVPTWSSFFGSGPLSGCSACHQGSVSSSLFSMTSPGTAHDNLVMVDTTPGNQSCPDNNGQPMVGIGSKRVVPFNPNVSALIQVVSGQAPCMSQQMGNLTPSEVDDLRDWILLGAVEN